MRHVSSMTAAEAARTPEVIARSWSLVRKTDGCWVFRERQAAKP